MADFYYGAEEQI